MDNFIEAQSWLKSLVQISFHEIHKLETTVLVLVLGN